MVNSDYERILKEQSEILAPIRARILRKIGINQRKTILDLGAGCGTVTEELSRRSGGLVIAIDRDKSLLKKIEPSENIIPILADANTLPFKSEMFDLVFAQFSLMWMDIPLIIKEIFRILKQNGCLVAIEPEYSGMIEYPESIALKEIWISALRKNGAEPFATTRILNILKQMGFKIQIDTISEISEPTLLKYELLKSVILSDIEKQKVEQIYLNEQKLPKNTFIINYLPVFIIQAQK